MIKSVQKALTILDYVADKGRASVKDLSLRMGMPKSTVCRLAQTLEASGYMYQDKANGDYILSYKFFRVGRDILEKMGIHDCVLPVISHLAEAIGETVNFTVLDGYEVLYLEKLESSMLHTGIKVGARAPLHCTASGKAMLANLPEDTLNDILEKTLPLNAHTDLTIVTKEALLSELEECRKRGYSMCKEELAAGVYAIGAYVSGYPGRIAAAISVAGPSNRFTEDRLHESSSLVINAAKEISRKFKAF